MAVNAFRMEKRDYSSSLEAQFHGKWRQRRPAFDRTGRPVEFRVIEGFGHGWPRGENERVWEFLEEKQRLGEAGE